MTDNTQRLFENENGDLEARRSADTNDAAANVASAFNRFGENLANDINSIGTAYAATKQSQTDNANATRQLNHTAKQPRASKRVRISHLHPFHRVCVRKSA